MIKFCPLYREAAQESIGIGLGFCDLDGFTTICEGDIQFCEKPEQLKNYLSRKVESTNGEIQKQILLIQKMWLEISKRKTPSYRVLVVDDDKSIVEVVQRILNSRGHNTEGAHSGAEALKKLDYIKFNAVISDIVMPEMNGIVLLKKILEKYPDMPVMVMTGFTEEFSSEIAILNGAREFIKKPFSITEFLIRFNKMMRELGQSRF